MLQLDVLQNQWVILAIGGGLALALVLVLVYMAFWRNLAGGDAEAAQPRRIPWFLILLYAAILVFGISYMVFNIRNPPTW